MKTIETKDYSIFKKNKANRDLCERNIKDLMRSISYKNLLNYKPIIVNNNMEIIDGQHRLEAAKRLDVPVFYQIIEDSDVSNIPIMNVQKSWKLEDFCNFYSHNGNDNYTKLLKFIDKYDLAFSTGFAYICDRKDKLPFKRGDFIFPDSDKIMNILINMENTKTVIDFIKQKNYGDVVKVKYITNIRFYQGLVNFLSIKSVDFSAFMNRLELKLDWIKNCPTVGDFMQLFKRIYNYNNRNKITVEEDLINFD